jgi:pyruvate dehydrogenase E2 component (dihydrolipoamide acetyltransferase)
MMPKGSDTMTEGKVLKWLKQEGDVISTGDTVVEIETDKVNMEVEAMGSGVLRKILVAPDKVVPVGELLAVIGKPDEDISTFVKGNGAAAPQPGLKSQELGAGTHAPAVAQTFQHAAPGPQSRAAGPRPPAPGPQPPIPTPHPPFPPQPPRPEPPAPSSEPVAVAAGRVFASPLARRMAKEMGLELANITGTGPNGRITRQDVERRAAIAPPPVAASTAAGGPVPARAPTPSIPRRLVLSPAGPEYSDEPLSSMRKVIATRLVQSKAPVPHFYLAIEVDMKRAKELRESANLLSPELKISYNDIILKACAAALRLNPEVNASFQGESIRYHHRFHLGMAVAIDGGLITPVVRNADIKSLAEIASESKDLVARARTRKLLPEEYTGSTFSVSNLGMMGIDEFSAVINPPEGAILAVGAVAEKAVVVDGRVEAGLRCRLTLSCDHRVVDGALGAKFLQSLKQILENPVYLAF